MATIVMDENLKGTYRAEQSLMVDQRFGTQCKTYKPNGQSYNICLGSSVCYLSDVF